MPKVRDIPQADIGADIRGKLGPVVFQKTGPGFGGADDPDLRYLQCRRHVIPADPRTQAQRRQRRRMRNAVVWWRRFRPEGQALVNEFAKQPYALLPNRPAKQYTNGFQLVMAAFCAGGAARRRLEATLENIAPST